MKKGFLSGLAAAALLGAIIIPSTNALAKNLDNISNIKIESTKLLAENDVLKDGKYTESIQVLKEKDNDLSMAGQYIGQKIDLDVKDGTIYGSVHITRLDWMKNIQIFIDNEEVSYDTKKENEEAGILTFKMPNPKTQMVFKMNVVPMGDVRVAFRVVPQNDIEAVGKEKSERKSDTTNSNSKAKKEGELPKTGFPITQGDLPALGAISGVLGLAFWKKKDK